MLKNRKENASMKKYQQRNKKKTIKMHNGIILIIYFIFFK